MSDKNEMPSNLPNVSMGLNVSAQPQGSHAILSIFAVGGFVLVILSFTLSFLNSTTWSVYASFILGLIILYISYKMWLMSYKSQDYKPVTNSEIAFSETSLRISGPTNFIQRKQIQDFVLEILLLKGTQENLPPPDGIIQGDPKEFDNIKLLSETEKEIVQKESEAKILQQKKDLELLCQDLVEISRGEMNTLKIEQKIPRNE